MAWDDLSKSLGTVIDERLSNPLVSSVAISWVGWNYKFFFVLFSGDPVANKLFMLDVLYPLSWMTLLTSLVAPVLTAYVYVKWLPKVSHPFFRQWRHNLKAFNGIKEEVPLEQMITQTEKIELLEEQSKVQEQNDLLKAENRKLKADLGIAVAKTDNYDALATNNGKLVVKVDELEDSVTQKDAELSKLKAYLVATRTQARMLEVRKIALESYLATEGAQKDPQSIDRAIQVIERAVNETYGAEAPSLNVPRVNGVNFVEVVNNIVKKLDERDQEAFISDVRGATSSRS